MAGGAKKKTLMRSLGEFFGHVAKGVTTDPAKDRSCHEVKRTVEEEERPGMVLRRTTIEEVEFKNEPNDDAGH